MKTILPLMVCGGGLLLFLSGCRSDPDAAAQDVFEAAVRDARIALMEAGEASLEVWEAAARDRVAALKEWEAVAREALEAREAAARAMWEALKEWEARDAEFHATRARKPIVPHGFGDDAAREARRREREAWGRVDEVERWEATARDVVVLAMSVGEPVAAWNDAAREAAARDRATALEWAEKLIARLKMERGVWEWSPDEMPWCVVGDPWWEALQWENQREAVEELKARKALELLELLEKRKVWEELIALDDDAAVEAVVRGWGETRKAALKERIAAGEAGEARGAWDAYKAQKLLEKWEVWETAKARELSMVTSR